MQKLGIKLVKCLGEKDCVPQFLQCAFHAYENIESNIENGPNMRMYAPIAISICISTECRSPRGTAGKAVMRRVNAGI
jgi:hypothetical protein